MQLDHKRIELLKHLLEIIRISHKGFEDAAAQVVEAVLKTRFQQFSQQRLVFAQKLEALIKQQGEDLDVRSFEGTMMRAWIDFKSGLIGKDTPKIIDLCLKEEKTSEIEYENALKEQLPDELTEEINHQYMAILDTMHHLREFKKEYS